MENSIKKILAADDSPIVRKLLDRILKTLGHEVELASDGADFFEKFYRDEYHLVILDLNMPSMSGMEILEEIKRQEVYKHLPVFILSSLSDEEHIKRAIELGACQYFIKPPKEDKFLFCVRQYLDQKDTNLRNA